MCDHFLVWCFRNSLCLVYGCLLLRTSVYFIYLFMHSYALQMFGGNLEFLEGKLSPPEVPRINPDYVIGQAYGHVTRFSGRGSRLPSTCFSVFLEFLCNDGFVVKNDTVGEFLDKGKPRYRTSLFAVCACRSRTVLIRGIMWNVYTCKCK